MCVLCNILNSKNNGAIGRVSNQTLCSLVSTAYHILWQLSSGCSWMDNSFLTKVHIYTRCKLPVYTALSEVLMILLYSTKHATVTDETALLPNHLLYMYGSKALELFQFYSHYHNTQIHNYPAQGFPNSTHIKLLMNCAFSSLQ